jgi:hypothetical protein
LQNGRAHRELPLPVSEVNPLIVADAPLAVTGCSNNVGTPTVCRRTLGHSDAVK